MHKNILPLLTALPGPLAGFNGQLCGWEGTNGGERRDHPPFHQLLYPPLGAAKICALPNALQIGCFSSSL